eukprot:320854_1
MGETCSVCLPLNAESDNKFGMDHAVNDHKIQQSKTTTIFSKTAVADKTLCIDRIKFILNIYVEFIKDCERNNNHANQGMYSKITTLYASDNIDSFILDYNFVVTNTNENNYYLDGECNIDECNFVVRNYRNVHQLEQDNGNARSKLYHSQTIEKDIVISQILDCVHNLIYHSYDMGYKLDQETKQNDLDFKYDETITEIMAIIRAKKDHFAGIRLDISDENIINKQRFVVQVSNKFCFGFRYYYHSYYKNNHKTSEMFENGMYEVGNTGYCYNDWYIDAKYKSLKDELLNNKILALHYKHLENTVTKATIKWQTLRHNNIANDAWQLIYNIKRGSFITVNHVMAILLYCNFTDLNYYFTETFRKLTNNESDVELKLRHMEYAIWGKLLREAIETYGTWLRESPLKYFYTGLSSPLLFDSFTQNIYCPLSTSIQKEVALNFAETNGIVIQIKNEKSAGTYFNCVPLSDFPTENERLFIGGIMPLSIMGLLHIPTCSDFTIYVRAMVMFDRCVHGSTSKNGEKLLKIYSSCGKKLVKKRLNVYDKPLPQYMVQLFTQMCNSFETVNLDVNLLNADLVHNLDDVWNIKSGFGDCYGYKRWKNIFIDVNGNFKLKDINKLFPISTKFSILCRQPVKDECNKYKYLPSVNINESMLQNI